MQKLTNLLVVLFVAFFACQSIATESPLYEPKDKELENEYQYEEFSAPPFPFMIERPLVCERSDMLISKLSGVQAQVPLLNGMGDMVDRNSNEEFQVKIFISVNFTTQAFTVVELHENGYGCVLASGKDLKGMEKLIQGTKIRLDKAL